MISAYNERVKAYKNASFDILFDKDASQTAVFNECGIPNLVRQVVDVSHKSVPILIRVTIQPSLPMGKPVQARLFQWKVTSMRILKKEYLLLSLRTEKMKESYLDASDLFLN